MVGRLVNKNTQELVDVLGEVFPGAVITVIRGHRGRRVAPRPLKPLPPKGKRGQSHRRPRDR